HEQSTRTRRRTGDRGAARYRAGKPHAHRTFAPREVGADRDTPNTVIRMSLLGAAQIGTVEEAHRMRQLHCDSRSSRKMTLKGSPMSELLKRGDETRYDLGLLFTDGLPELDDSTGYRGAVAARAAGISYRQL